MRRRWPWFGIETPQVTRDRLIFSLHSSAIWSILSQCLSLCAHYGGYTYGYFVSNSGTKLMGHVEYVFFSILSEILHIASTNIAEKFREESYYGWGIIREKRFLAPLVSHKRAPVP